MSRYDIKGPQKAYEFGESDDSDEISPNCHLRYCSRYILHIVFYSFPKVSTERIIDNQDSLQLVIISLFFVILMLESGVVWSGDIGCQLPVGQRGLKGYKESFFSIIMIYFRSLIDKFWNCSLSSPHLKLQYLSVGDLF